MPNLDRYHYIMLALLVASLFAHGAREHTRIVEVENTTNQISTLRGEITEAHTQYSQLETASKKRMATNKKKTPVLIGGVVAYIEEETSESVEEALSSLKNEYQSQIKALTDENVVLVTKLSSKDVEITKSAPRWSLIAGWEPIQQGYYAGGGINVGPFSIIVDNPTAAVLQPRLSLVARF